MALPHGDVHSLQWHMEVRISSVEGPDEATQACKQTPSGAPTALTWNNSILF